MKGKNYNIFEYLRVRISLTDSDSKKFYNYIFPIFK